MDYLTVHSTGFITYTDAIIARVVDSGLQAYLMSIIGSPSHVQASAALLFGGQVCRVSNGADSVLDLRFTAEGMRTVRNRKIGNTVNKIIACPRFFMDISQKAIVFGPDMVTIKKRAFIRFNAASSIPLKQEWQDWLFDEILEPEKLHSFGDENLQEAYFIQWPDDTLLEERVLEAVRMNYLT